MEDAAPAPVAPTPDDLTADASELQRRCLRRILVAFLILVVLLPLAGIGGGFAWLVLPLVLVAAFAFREGLRLRRSVRQAGAAPEQ